MTRQLLRPSTWLVALPTPEDVTAERLGALEALAIALGDSVDGAAEASAVLDRGRELASQAGRLDSLSARFWSLAGEQRYMSSDVVGALAAHDAAIRTHDAAIAAANSPAGNEAVAAHVDRARARPIGACQCPSRKRAAPGGHDRAGPGRPRAGGPRGRSPGRHRRTTQPR